jgi:hypothetical protein
LVATWRLRRKSAGKLSRRVIWPREHQRVEQMAIAQFIRL